MVVATFIFPEGVSFWEMQPLSSGTSSSKTNITILSSLFILPLLYHAFAPEFLRFLPMYLE